MNKQMHKRLRVGVLMGGKSIEREVSLNSGRTICDHLDTTRYEVIPLFQTKQGLLYILPWVFLHRGKTSDFEHRLAQEAKKITWDSLKTQADFIYIAQHGRYAEDGCLQGFLEVLQIPYLGSKVLPSALGMNKSIQKDILSAHGIKTPHGVTLTPRDLKNYKQNIQALEQLLERSKLTYPLIVKPHKEGSSFGIQKVNNIHNLINALESASTIHSTKQQNVLIENYIKGMEFSCIVIYDYKTGKLKALPATEIVLEKGQDIFDYDQKYMPGRATKHTPARCSAESMSTIRKTACAVVKALEFTTIARIDGFLTNSGEVIITDPNSFSGMAPSSYAFLQAAEAHMNHTDLINHLIETELHHYGMLESLQNQESKTSMNQKKLRVAVLLGGASNEKEISLESGRNISYKLSPQKYEISTVFVSKNLELFTIPSKLLVRNSTHEIETDIKPEMQIKWDELPYHFDFIFLGLHGGAGENGSIQGTLEMLGLPYNGSSVLTSALCMDKYKTNNLLHSKGFSVPQNYLINKQEFDNHKKNNRTITLPFNYPVIIKPHDDGCSVMVQKAKNSQELNSALNTIFSQNKEHALIEECIVGMELTGGVIGNNTAYALPPSQAVSTSEILSIEEKFLPGAGENQTPAPLPEKQLNFVQKTLENVYTALECKGYVRIDCFYQTAEQSPTKQERVVIIEINTLPGMTPATCIFHQAAEVGIKPMDFIDLIVQLGLEEHTQNHRLSLEHNKLFEQKQN